jgi:hypothetical protein
MGTGSCHKGAGLITTNKFIRTVVKSYSGTRHQFNDYCILGERESNGKIGSFSQTRPFEVPVANNAGKKKSGNMRTPPNFCCVLEPDVGPRPRT